jgi:hypothetical protein
MLTTGQPTRVELGHREARGGCTEGQRLSGRCRRTGRVSGGGGA